MSETGSAEARRGSTHGRNGRGGKARPPRLASCAVSLLAALAVSVLSACAEEYRVRPVVRGVDDSLSREVEPGLARTGNDGERDEAYDVPVVKDIVDEATGQKGRNEAK